MFLNIIKFRESILSVIFFIINIFIVDGLYLLEFVFCKLIPRTFFFSFSSSSIHKKKINQDLLMYKIWNWPAFIQSLFSFHPSLPKSCYLVENIVYATTNGKRFVRSTPLLEPNEWYQVIQPLKSFYSTNSGGSISTIQAVDNPTALNNPLLLSPAIWTRVKNLFRSPNKQVLYTGQEEESLILNVWMPTNNNNTSPTTTISSSPEKESKKPFLLPVYVFCCGGAFTFGSAGQSMHDPRDFVTSSSSSSSSIVVTINQRLGVLGFLQGLEEEGIEPNLGMTDLVNALLWVKKNIFRFGGDAENICVIGQSAGALQLSALLVSPYIKHVCEKYKIIGCAADKNGDETSSATSPSPLFKSVVLMSGAALHVHGKIERRACGDIMKMKIRQVLLMNSVSDDDEEENINYKQLLLQATPNDLVRIQQLYCQHIDTLYRNCELETRFIPFNLCVCSEDELHKIQEKNRDDDDNDSHLPLVPLIPTHPQIVLRELANKNKNKIRQLNNHHKKSSSKSTSNHCDDDELINCHNVLITTTGSEYTMFALKHQPEEILNNDELQIKRTMKRAKQFVAASFQRERNDPLVSELASKLVGCYVTLWKQEQHQEQEIHHHHHQQRHQYSSSSSKSSRSNYITRQFETTTTDPSLIFKGQLWSVFCGDWVFRMPAEALAQELETIFSSSSSCPSSSYQQRRNVQMMRFETPCDPIPNLSSPHTSDVPFLFGGLHVFPAICSYKWFYCKKRQILSKRIQRAVKEFHTTFSGDDDESSSSSSQHLYNDDDNKVNLPDSDKNKFWRPNYSTRNISVFRLSTMEEDDETEFERALCNQKFDPVLAELMEFRK